MSEKSKKPQRKSKDGKPLGFAPSIDPAAVVKAWAELPTTDGIGTRLEAVAAKVGCSSRQVRRILVANGAALGHGIAKGSRGRVPMAVTFPSLAEAKRGVAEDPAAMAAHAILAGARVAGVPLRPVAAGLVLGQVLTTQRGRAATLGESVHALATELADLTRPKFQDGQRLPLSPEQLHWCAKTAGALTDMVVKLNEEERALWGIKPGGDDGESWSAMLDRLDRAQIVDGQLVEPVDSAVDKSGG